MTFSFRTAGESHGRGVYALLEGVPHGLPLDLERINALLRLRQGGYGRGGRQKLEHDSVQALSGVRRGVTLGSPLLLAVENRDLRIDSAGPVTRPRPGHADLAGCLSHGITDARGILERASARETAARVAAGGVAQLLLAELGMRVAGHVVSIGGIRSGAPAPTIDHILANARDPAGVYCCDPKASAEMIGAIDAARKAGDTLGGVVEVRATGVLPGLGTHTRWDRRLDGRLARAAMSVQAVKGVEIGLGFEAARRPGSRVHDPIRAGSGNSGNPAGFTRDANNAGGIEGGITNGEDVILRAAMKPISTLMAPLDSVDLETGATALADTERSDVCAVPACAIVVEAMVALALAEALRDRFGGPTLDHVRMEVNHYRASLSRFRRP